MDTSRISALLEPFLDRPLIPAQLDQTLMYIDLLLRWNARINLTAIRNPEEIVTRHFGESFFLARHVFPEGAKRAPLPSPAQESELLAIAHKPLPTVLDLGSGAGFPGLPIKIWAPQIQLTLIESNHRKAAFLREVVRALTLTDVDVIAERAEVVADRIADIVTFRAVEKFDRTLPLSLRFLAPRGRLAILISSSQFNAISGKPLHSNSKIPHSDATAPMQWHTFSVPQSCERILALATFVSWELLQESN